MSKEILKRLDALEAENLKLNFLVNNPPKYKVGQQVNGMIVTEVKLKNESFRDIVLTGFFAYRWVTRIYRYHWEYLAIKKGMDKPVSIV